jgi:hypothetical protein
MSGRRGKGELQLGYIYVCVARAADRAVLSGL